jgi:hypothetical protein
MSAPEPTKQDRENAAVRAEVAERFRSAYAKVAAWALGAFGPGWVPSHRHELVEKSAEEYARRTGERAAPSAVVYTVKNGDGRQRHFVVEDGHVREVASYEEGFGEQLLEPDTRTIEVRGQQVHPHKYSLCWADYPLYEPKSAEELAALRLSRERGKVAREEVKFQRENPLLAWAEREQRHKGEGAVGEKR